MKRNKDKKYTGGFTLIELLVVIAIIAILSTVVMAGLNSARAKGRDAKRLSDIKQVQAAMELYFDSCAGYPATFTMPTTPATALSVPPTVSTGCTSPTTLGTFILPLPVNPTPLGANYAYTGTPGRDSYTITFSLEGQSGSLGAGTHTASPSGIL